MGVARVDESLLGEVVLLRLLGNARFQGTLHGISGDVVGAGCLARSEQGLRLSDSRLGKLMEVRTVHRRGQILDLIIAVRRVLWRSGPLRPLRWRQGVGRSDDASAPAHRI